MLVILSKGNMIYVGIEEGGGEIFENKVLGKILPTPTQTVVTGTVKSGDYYVELNQ